MEIYIFSGQENSKQVGDEPVVNFDECINSIKQKVLPLVNPKPITLKQSSIAAFSYYFDRAIETGLVGMKYSIDKKQYILTQ